MHIMKLQEEYFNFIKNGTKQYEIRLNDEKRRKIKVGDYIEFQKEPTLEEKIVFEVEKLLYYSNFSDLLNDIQISELADSSISKEELNRDLEKFYSMEKQKKYGVVGIKLKKNIMVNHSRINDVSISNDFFDPLRYNYCNFDNWLTKMKKNNVDIFYSESKNRITSLLILKIKENDSQQFFKDGNILKIRTLLVKDNNKGIGTMYFKMIDDIAKDNSINYIYLTIKNDNDALIRFVSKKGYKKYNKINDEFVYYKEIK